MIVRPEHCTVPKCKGCGMYVGHEHAEGCLIVLADAVRRKRSNANLQEPANKL